MTLKNNRASLLWYFKLCATFHRHRWIETGITVWKRPIWVKIGDFLSGVTLKYDGWPWKAIGHLSYITLSFLHHFIDIGEFKLELQFGNGQVGFWPLWPWPFAWTSLLSLEITPENFMMIRWWEHSEKGVTDGQTDRRMDRQTYRQTDGLNHL